MPVRRRPRTDPCGPRRALGGAQARWRSVISGNEGFQSESAKKHQAKGRADARQSRGSCASHPVRAHPRTQVDAWIRSATSIVSIDALF